MSEITTVADIVRVHGRDRADQTALILDDRSMTWSELYERAQRVAQAMSAAGVGSQDRVAFLDKNGIEHFEVFFGAALLGAVCVDVNWRLALAGDQVKRAQRLSHPHRRRQRHESEDKGVDHPSKDVTLDQNHRTSSTLLRGRSGQL